MSALPRPGPAQVAVAIKIALAALGGQVVPQSVRLPTAVASWPDLKEGVGANLA